MIKKLFVTLVLKFFVYFSKQQRVNQRWGPLSRKAGFQVPDIQHIRFSTEVTG